MAKINYTKKWTKYAKDRLVGKKITNVEYMTKEECKEAGWHKRPICIQLNHEIWISPMQDDEGNDSGVMSYSGYDSEGFEDITTLPVLGLED